MAMKKIILFCLCLSTLTSIAQQQTYDLITFTPPKGWKKKNDVANVISYSTTDNVKRTWAQIGVIKSTTSKGSIDADFENEWKELVVKPYQQYGVTEQPLAIDTQTFNGWKLRTGLGKFVFNKDTSIILLNTFSNGQRCASLTMMSNTNAYGEILDNFLASVNLPNPGTAQHQNNVNNSITSTTITNTDFKFNTSNFDDGWTSTVQEDWVEVTKGSMKVLLHYPKEGTIFPADPDVLTTTAWNILVAPRYSNLKNYRTAYITTYNRPYLGMGYATENSTGKEVFVLLFRQGEGWIEFITPDKNTFIQQYKFDPETVKWDTDSDLMNPLANMKGYNRFAVATSDFKGKWTSDFTGIQQMYNVYTGNYAGMNMHQSNIIFDFKGGNSYYWKLIAVNGMVGNLKFDQVESTGTFSVPNNWQLKCSKIEKGPKLYHAFWSCIKGARILNLLDADAPGSGIYTKYGLAK
jgi:hypothetical protein